MKVENVIHWMNERQNILISKLSGVPYKSSDFRMHQYRFCNVSREDDKVTRKLRETWIKPTANSNDLPLAVLMARRINSVAAFEHMFRPKDFSYKGVLRAIEAADRAHGSSVVNTGPYSISAAQVAFKNLGPGHSHRHAVAWLMEKSAETFDETRYETLEETAKSLDKIYGVSDFMNGQIIADLKRTDYLKNAPDWWEWAIIGPGSRRGLNRVYGNDLEDKSGDKNFLDRLKRMRDAVEPHLGAHIPRLCLQDYQNVMCEYDKYERNYNKPNTGKQYKSR